MDLIRERTKSFEMLGRGGNTREPQIVKYPIKRVEVTIQKFIKVLEMDLERLTKHQNNILKFQRLGDFEALNKEQMNASRTVQQLSSNLRQLEQTRNQVQEDDLNKFDLMISDIKQLAVRDLEQFLSLHGQQAKTGVSGFTTELKAFDACCMKQQSGDTGPQQTFEQTGSHQLEEVGPESTREELLASQAKCAAAEQSWLELEQNLSDLNDVMQDFSQIVHHQQKTINTIEENVDESQANIQQGTSYLAEAAKYKGALFPVLGALIGGSLGGPIGILAGLKVGGVAALGGGLMGLTGGTLLKKRRQAMIDEDMEDIQERERHSVHVMKKPGMWKGVFVIAFIISTSMYLLVDNGQRTSSSDLRKQILDLSQQYVRQLSEDLEHGLDDPSLTSHDLSKPIAVVLFSLLRRIEYLENQVNRTLAETLQLQRLQKLKNCTQTGNNAQSSEELYRDVDVQVKNNNNKVIIQPDGSLKRVVINTNTLPSLINMSKEMMEGKESL